MDSAGEDGGGGGHGHDGGGGAGGAPAQAEMTEPFHHYYDYVEFVAGPPLDDEFVVPPQLSCTLRGGAPLNQEAQEARAQAEKQAGASVVTGGSMGPMGADGDGVTLGWGAGVVTSCVLRQCRAAIADALAIPEAATALQCTADNCSPWTDECVKSCGTNVAYMAAAGSGDQNDKQQRAAFDAAGRANQAYTAFHECVDEHGCVEAGFGWGFGVSSLCAETRCGEAQQKCVAMGGCRRGLTCLQYSCPLWTTACVNKCGAKALPAVAAPEGGDGGAAGDTRLKPEDAAAAEAFAAVSMCLRERGCVDLSRESMATTLAQTMKWNEGVDSLCVHRRCEHKIEKALLNPLATKALQCTLACERWSVDCIANCTQLIVDLGGESELQAAQEAEKAGEVGEKGDLQMSAEESNRGWFSAGGSEADAEGVEMADDDDDDDLMVNEQTLAALNKLAADDDATAEEWAEAFKKWHLANDANEEGAEGEQEGDGQRRARGRGRGRGRRVQERGQRGGRGTRLHTPGLHTRRSRSSSGTRGSSLRRRSLMSANATRAALRAFEELALCVHEHGCIDENVYNDADGSAVSAGFQLGVSQVCAFSRCADEEERCREDLQCRAGLECSTSLCQPYAPECALSCAERTVVDPASLANFTALQDCLQQQQCVLDAESMLVIAL
eukprot:g1063.t1